ncbi:protein kinase [Streptomyces sp. NBC_00249]|uniref:serine/threonine-protein kinase n=1 Tax=Streptomyces sp. NBC_00249 TaxID=2975690 RepID=UPI00225C0FB0|nr:protein kinase [Streptomyces sp. NBC_00249]MCX5194853.1 protein kinase [Streptomyces sp. NBC_00249]
MLELTGSGAEPLEADDPRRIGPIPLAGRLGAGGMGRVYLGVQDGRYVAVKQLLSSVVGEDADFVRRFGHELDNLARLPAGATTPLLASDRTARPPWFATAYVPGITLREAVDLHGGPLPARALWLLLKEAAAGLAQVHALDMVHRDLKPSNVMLTSDGLTLIDFGIARAAEQSQLTRTGMVVGTPAYMAPEQASGKKGQSGATDVFALGSVLAYAASGQPPFGDESGHGVLYRIVHEEPDLEPLRELDADLAELVGTCLAKDPEDRPTAAQLLERASRRGPFTTPLWPDAISGRLFERAAFAADVQDVDVPTLPLAGTKPEPEAVPAPEPVVAEPRTEQPKRRPERRRTRVLLAVFPVVVVAGGTTLAIQYLPHTGSPQAGPAGSPPASVSAPANPSAPAQAPSSAGPSGTPSPSASPSGDPAQAASATPQPPAASGGPGNTPAPGPNPGPATGNGGGSGGPSTSTSTGSGGGKTTAAPPPAPAPPPPASGTHRYRNGDNGDCITQVYGSSDHGSCSDGSARWTVRGRGDGSFKLVNEQSGACLYSNGLGQAVFVGDCAQDIGRIWRTGPDGSLRSDLGGGCLDLPMAGGLNTSRCAGEASQRWSPV